MIKEDISALSVLAVRSSMKYGIRRLHDSVDQVVAIAKRKQTKNKLHREEEHANLYPIIQTNFNFCVPECGSFTLYWKFNRSKET